MGKSVSVGGCAANRVSQRDSSMAHRHEWALLLLLALTLPAYAQDPVDAVVPVEMLDTAQEEQPKEDGSRESPAQTRDWLAPTYCGERVSLAPPMTPHADSATFPQALFLEADAADIDPAGVSSYFGNVSIQRGAASLQADTLDFRHSDETLEASGNIRFRQGDLLQIQGDAADVDLRNNRGEFNNARFFESQEGGRGEAQRIAVEGRDLLILEDTSYTTCASEKPAWKLTTGKLTLDQEKHQGTARGVVLRAKNVPVFYFPYMRFPIGDERLSGFLAPSFGSTDSSGTELRLPYYWNIAPNMDATFTPRYMSERGTMLESEFRYLFSSNGGTLDLSYLPSDQKFDDSRGAARWRHGQGWKYGWSGRVDYGRVSDTSYLEDFGGDLAATSVSHIEQLAEVANNSEHWVFNSRVQTYQTLSGDSPYKRLPQFTLKKRPQPPNRINWQLDTEIVRFDSDTLIPTGSRLDLQPGVSYPYRTPGSFVTPKLLMRYTAYDLTDVDTGQPENPTRSVPVFSVDSGLIFERGIGAGGFASTVTLEPRVKYIYIPERDQTDLPNFDSTRITPTLNQLFEEYQFTGADRVAATNRITAAVSTRFVDDRSGAERLVAGIGQAYEVESQQDVPTTSNVFAELHGRTDAHWVYGGRIEWNPHTQETEIGNAVVQYRTGRDNVAMLRYRFLRDQIESWQYAVYWRVSRSWQLIGSQQYDLLQRRDTERIFGFQYDSCCWGFRVVSRDFVVNESNEFNRTIFFEFVLKGLSNVGQQGSIDNLLNRAILP